MNKDYPEKIIVVPRFTEANGFYTTEQRSLTMSKIRSKDTKPEIALRKALWILGLKYRVNVKKLPGSPDILMRKYKLAIFVDGEFWHGYNWNERKHKLKANKEFWISKIERNMQRDKLNEEKLSLLGFNILRFWDHEIKKDISNCIDRILSQISINI